MALFPGALPAAGSANSTDTLAAAGHTALHNTAYDELRALATKLGINSSTPAANQVLRGTGAGTSAWGQVSLSGDVTGVLPVANGGTGVSTSTGTGSTVLSNSPTLTSPTLNTPTLNTPAIATFASAQHDHTNAAGGGQLGTGALQDSSVTGVKIANYRMPFQADTTNSTQLTVIMQAGWGWKLGDGTNFIEETVTFPNAFSSILAVFPCSLGFLSGSDPTSIGSFTSGFNGGTILAHAKDITTTSFTIRMSIENGLTIGNTLRCGYSWIAMGT